MTDELWRARFNVKRAVLDCVAHDYHDEPTASSVHHGDYLEDMLDEALAEYVRVSNEMEVWDSIERVKRQMNSELNRRAD